MKKFCIIFLTSIIIILTAVGFGGCFTSVSEPTDYLRIHIRADSNEESAQTVKYLVRDKVVEYLTPIVASCESKQTAMKSVKTALTDIESVAKGVLVEQGYTYGASAKVATENFPTRVYGEYTLDAGEYTALIIELGSGKGDNWWCVVYPPLCFTGATGENVVYKSKILEIIERWKNG